jgi:hypothetical protein
MKKMHYKIQEYSLLCTIDNIFHSEKFSAFSHQHAYYGCSLLHLMLHIHITGSKKVAFITYSRLVGAMSKGMHDI